MTDQENLKMHSIILILICGDSGLGECSMKPWKQS